MKYIKNSNDFNFDELSKLIQKNKYSINEYEKLLPQIEALSKKQIIQILKEFWDNSTTELRFKIIKNFQINLKSIGFYEEIYIEDDEIDIMSKLNYDGLMKYNNKGTRGWSIPRVELREAIEFWLRIGDHRLSIGGLNYLKENNLTIDSSNRYKNL